MHILGFKVPSVGTVLSEDVCECLGLLDDWHYAGVDMLSAPRFLQQCFRMNAREAVAVLNLWLVMRPGQAASMN